MIFWIKKKGHLDSCNMIKNMHVGFILGLDIVYD